jgi:hypothetical protein
MAGIYRSAKFKDKRCLHRPSLVVTNGNSSGYNHRQFKISIRKYKGNFGALAFVLVRSIVVSHSYTACMHFSN